MNFDAAVELVDRTVAAGPKFPHRDYAYVQFVKGLTEYRQGQPKQAIDYLEPSAEKLPQPRRSAVGAGHGAVRSGSTKEAQQTERIPSRANRSGANAERSFLGGKTFLSAGVSLFKEISVVVIDQSVPGSLTTGTEGWDIQLPSG
jgi:hypothetical protein